MNEQSNPYLLSGEARRLGWPQRVLIAVVGLTLAVAAFFFLMFALVAGAVVAAAIGIRWWWLMRKVREQQRNTAALEGEYTVIERADTTERLER